MLCADSVNLAEVTPKSRTCHILFAKSVHVVNVLPTCCSCLVYLCMCTYVCMYMYMSIRIRTCIRHSTIPGRAIAHRWGLRAAWGHTMTSRMLHATGLLQFQVNVNPTVSNGLLGACGNRKETTTTAENTQKRKHDGRF